MFGHDVWNETDSNSRDVDFKDSQTTLAKLNAAIHHPTVRSYDDFSLLHGRVNLNTGKQNRLKVSDHILASGLSDFTGSARFNSSRLKNGQLFELDTCPLKETCRICSALVKPNPIESVLERTTKSTLPDATDILLERADTWRNKSTPNGIGLNNSLTKASKSFQPKSWQNFKPEFTQPYRFTYFLDNNHS